MLSLPLEQSIVHQLQAYVVGICPTQIRLPTPRLVVCFAANRCEQYRCSPTRHRVSSHLAASRIKLSIHPLLPI